MQKINAPTYTATTKLRFHPSYEGDRAGLIVMGHDYATIGLRYADGRLLVERTTCKRAMKKGAPETADASLPFAASGEPVDVWFRCRFEQQWNDDATPRLVCRLSFSTDGKRFRELGDAFTAEAGHWIGAKVGYFADAQVHKNDAGWIDVDWFRTSK